MTVGRRLPLRRTFFIVLLSCELSLSAGQDDKSCQSCRNSEERLQFAEKELVDCNEKLNQVLEGSSSYMDQLTSWITKANTAQPAKQAIAFRGFLSKLLKVSKLDIKPENLPETASVALSLEISKSDIVKMQRLLLAEEGTQADILSSLAKSIEDAELIGDASSGWWINRFQFNDLIMAQTVAVSILVLTCLLCGVAAWKVATIVFVGSWSWTWCHMYQLAVAKKQATLLRLGDVPKTCLVERQGWLSAVRDLITGGGQAAQCEAYYEALLVNPILEVTPIAALTEMVSQFVLRPLNVLGQHLGHFYTNLLEPLPWVWKLPVLLVATTIIVIVILIAFRYKMNFGFNLFCLEPTSHKSLGKSEESKKDDESKTGTRITNEYQTYKPLPYNMGPNLLDNLVTEDNRPHINS